MWGWMENNQNEQIKHEVFHSLWSIHKYLTVMLNNTIEEMTAVTEYI